MRISKFAIWDFLSLKDTQEVRVNAPLTLLLGGNETGKTNLLLALERFDREGQYDVDDLCRYSETRDSLTEGELSAEDVRLVTLWFDLDRSDRRQVGEIDKGLQGAKTLTATKYLDNHYTFEVDGKGVEDGAVQAQPPRLPNTIEKQLAEFESDLANHAARHPPFAESLPTLSNAVGEFKETIASGDLDQAFSTLAGQLAALPNQDGPIQELVATAQQELDALRQKMTAELQAVEGAGRISAGLMNMLPRFVYFEDVDLLEDSVPIGEFLANREEHRTLSNLVDLAGLDVERLQSQGAFRRSEATQRASARITGLVNDSGTQEEITVSIGESGPELYVVVEDPKGGYDPPTKRSKGFQWYLGFYINFSAGSEGELKNTVLLLDDPGVYLHATGQRDLLRTIVRLSGENQFVIATHSPFLIDRRHLERIRIVEKEEERRGTTFREKWHESKGDAFEPIRAALGMTLGDSLAVSGENVVVEGPADLFILSGMSRLCTRLKRASLDLDKVGIFPVDGAPKVPYWTFVLFKERLPVAAVLDHDAAGRREAKRMVEDLGIDQRLVMTLEEFGSRAECTDVELEDLIGPEFYHSAFELAYAGVFEGKKEKPPSLSHLPRVPCSRVKPYQDYFKQHKLGSFDKIAVARAIQNLCADLKTDEAVAGDSTIANFSRLFQRVREMLNTKL